MAAKKLSHDLGIVGAGRNCFNPLQDIVYFQQDVQVEGGNGPMKSIPHRSNSSTSRMGCMGGSSFLEMPPIR